MNVCFNYDVVEGGKGGGWVGGAGRPGTVPTVDGAVVF